MSFDFDEIIERRGTHSAKWDALKSYSGIASDDGIAMWVADMDFRPPPSVTDALSLGIAGRIENSTFRRCPARARR